MKNNIQDFIIKIGVFLLSVLFVMLLWNWLMPILFKLPEITYWQAIGLNMLANVLFKSDINNDIR